ncbi:MAG TPA: sialidase family protein [Thermomicrobiaceae bacterium]|nr:sialidase family protein [Thermomicrobiaceae bacterium]
MRAISLRSPLVVTLALVALLATALMAAAASADTLVTVGSPANPFSQNKQNEPAIAVDANHPNILVAGSNDNVDMEACNAGNDTTCPFTPGVGVSGVYFSFDSGSTWTQPTYTGLTGRFCLGVVGNTDPGCTPQFGPIGTLPWYYESGLASGGDPAVAFGPMPDASGHFSWANGSRLYYANLTANLGVTRSEQSFKGYEAVTVSRTDNVQAAAAGDKNAWMTPVLISKQSSTTFSDKEQIWADNAASSPFFGTAYVCWASFRSNGAGPAPLQVAVSHDGGTTWMQHQISAAANNSQVNPADGCTIRTDSHGNAYVFGVGSVSSQSHTSFELMSVSTNGGSTWSPLRAAVGPVTQPGILDPVIGRPTVDGIAGARSDLAPAPSVDIANGAPTGADATDRIVMSYVSGEITQPHVFFTESANGGATWTTPRAIEAATDRGYYAAPAISPNGSDVYIVYNAFETPYRDNTTDPRLLVGVVTHADVTVTGTGAFSELHRSAPGDPRGSSQNNLQAEFLGDYVYAVATRTSGGGVWNDTRNAADCPVIDAWRASLQTSSPLARPAPQQDCPATFGNSDIYGGIFPDPTP